MLRRCYETALSSAAAARHPRAAVSAVCDHVTQRGSEGAGWACGYRNIQMLCSALIRNPRYRPVLFDGSGAIPDIPTLQRWIEYAWGCGYDTAGCEQLGGRLLGTTTWIGAGECVALLRCFGIPAHQVVFHSFDSPYIAATLGGEAAAAAATARGAAEAALAASTGGMTPDRVLRPWAYTPTGELLAPLLVRAGGASGGPGGSAAAADMAALWRVLRDVPAGDDDADGAITGAPGPTAAGTGGDEDDWELQAALAASMTATTTVATASKDSDRGPRGRAKGGRGGSSGGGAPRLHDTTSTVDVAVREYLYARHAPLLSFLADYFAMPLAPSDGSSGVGTGSSPSPPPPPLPLYFQHDGHSRTLVGVECRRVGAGDGGGEERVGGRRGGRGKPRAGPPPQAKRNRSGGGDGFGGSGSGGGITSFFSTTRAPPAPAPGDAAPVHSARAVGEDGIDDADGGGALGLAWMLGGDDDGDVLPVPPAATRTDDGDAGSVVVVEEETGEGETGTAAPAPAPQPPTQSLAPTAGGARLPDAHSTFVSLLMLDPATSAFALGQSLTEGRGWEKMVKRGLHTMRKPVYEAVIVERDAEVHTGDPSSRGPEWKVLSQRHMAAGWR